MIVGDATPIVRTCACGCGIGFTTRSRRRKYLSDAHKNRASRDRAAANNFQGRIDPFLSARLARATPDIVQWSQWLASQCRSIRELECCITSMLLVSGDIKPEESASILNKSAKRDRKDGETIQLIQLEGLSE